MTTRTGRKFRRAIWSRVRRNSVTLVPLFSSFLFFFFFSKVSVLVLVFAFIVVISFVRRQKRLVVFSSSSSSSLFRVHKGVDAARQRAHEQMRLLLPQPLWTRCLLRSTKQQKNQDKTRVPQKNV